MLEIVLFALPRRDTKALAWMLLTRFGSFARVIAAPMQELLLSMDWARRESRR